MPTRAIASEEHSLSPNGKSASFWSCDKRWVQRSATRSHDVVSHCEVRSRADGEARLAEMSILFAMAFSGEPQPLLHCIPKGAAVQSCGSHSTLA